MNFIHAKKVYLGFIFSLCLIQNTYSQDFIMQNATISTCTGNFYDSGGANGSYNNNEDFTYTICPDMADFKLVVQFFEIGLGPAPTELFVYDGQDNNSPLLVSFDIDDNFSASDNPVTLIASENNLSGCLTFRFISSAFFQNTGWFAQLNCIESCEDTTATLNQIIPSNFNTTTSQYEVTIFESVTVEIDPVFTANNGNNPTYLWDFGDGNGPQTTSIPSIDYAFDSLGDYGLSISIIDDFNCPNDDILQIPFKVISPVNNFCQSAREVCFDTPTITLSNFNSANGGLPSAENGPDYGCLGQQPFPSWFYFKVQNSGDLTFTIAQNTTEDFNGVAIDIDFKIWGPFSSPIGNCDNLNGSTEVPDLPNGNVFDGCSYSATPVENMGVQNAQAGDFYIFVTTNFSQNQGFIKIEQTNFNAQNSGTIGCFDDLLGDNIQSCGSDPITLNSNVTNAVSYVWELFDPISGIYNLLTNETSSSLVVTPPGGLYRLTADIGTEILQDEVTIDFLNTPATSSPSSLLICDEDSDFRVFDLTVTLPEIFAGSVEPLIVTYYETQADADAEVNPIANPISYSNIVNPQTIFFRVENSATGCFYVGNFDLIVDPCFSINANDFALNDIKIYPNPSTDKIIYIENTSQRLQLEIIRVFDINGKLVFNQIMNSTQDSTFKLNLNQHIKGLYFLHIESNLGSVVKKIIVD